MREHGSLVTATESALIRQVRLGSPTSRNIKVLYLGPILVIYELKNNLELNKVFQIGSMRSSEASAYSTRVYCMYVCVCMCIFFFFF